MVYGLRKGAGYNYAGVVGECQMSFELYRPIRILVLQPQRSPLREVRSA